MAYTDTGSHFGYTNPGPLETTYLAYLEQCDDARRDAIIEAQKWYDGQHPDSLTTRKGEANDNVKLNYSRMVVDKGVSFLLGDRLEIEIEERTTYDADPEPVDPAAKKKPLPAQAYVDEWIEDTNLLARMQRFAQNGGIAGTAFYRLYPAAAGQVYPRVALLDPLNVSVLVDPDDHELVLAYKVQWTTRDLNADGSMRVRRSLVERDGDQWTIIEQESREKGDRWTTLDGYPEAWPYTWPPIGHCQNLPNANDFYGLADLPVDILDLNRAINGDASNLRRVNRLYAHPHDIGFGFTALEIETSPGGMTVLQSDKAKVQRLETTSQLEGPLGVYDRMRQAFHTMTRIPEVASGKLENAGSLSGVALSILYGPIVELTGAKRPSYGPCTGELALRVLELAGLGGALDYRARVKWPEVVPGDPESERRVAAMDHDLGVSKATILGNLGYDPEHEAEVRGFEDAASAEKQAQMFDHGTTPPGDPLGNLSTPPTQPGAPA